MAVFAVVYRGACSKFISKIIVSVASVSFGLWGYPVACRSAYNLERY